MWPAHPPTLTQPPHSNPAPLHLHTQGPVVAHYRWVEKKQKWFPPATRSEREAQWRALDDAHSGVILEMLRELKGM
jgi:hypothetical protein